MTMKKSIELDGKHTTPTSIEFTEDEVIIRLPRLRDVESSSSKMEVFATTNGWQKTNFHGPFDEQLQVNLFVGARK
jgi:hypothetical protein